jgi:hypothetical protein
MQVLTPAVALAAVALWWYFDRLRRSNDVRDLLATTAVRFEPRLSEVRMREFADTDRLTHGAAVDAMREFSRLYQESFVPTYARSAASLVTRMQDWRAVFVREMHALRMWLPNDLPKERRLLAAIEETDAAMELAVQDVSGRLKGTALLRPYVGRQRLFGGGVRAADDTWE